MAELAEYPFAEFVPADPSNYRRAMRLSYRRLIIHCTDGRPDPMAVARMWQVYGHRSSAHFVVGQEGRVIQCVRLRDVAYHAHLANSDSVGIEHCCRTPGELGPHDPGLPPSDAHYTASAKLAAWLLKAAGLPIDRGATLLGHHEADPLTTHIGCPESAGWQWGRYVAEVEAIYAALPAMP